MNKYQKFARQVAQTICDSMNLFYKHDEAEQFRRELLNHLSSLYFSPKENRFVLWKRARKESKKNANQNKI